MRALAGGRAPSITLMSSVSKSWGRHKALCRPQPELRWLGVLRECLRGRYERGLQRIQIRRIGAVEVAAVDDLRAPLTNESGKRVQVLCHLRIVRPTCHYG